MTVFGDLERFLSEDLYPYRVPITVGLVLAAVAAAALAYRLGWHIVAWRHRLLTGALAVVILAVAIPAGDYLLSPLWERSHLEEESPLVAAMDDMSPGSDGPAVVASPSPMIAVDTATPEPSPSPAFEPRVTHRGEFHGADDFHFGRGAALLIETAPGVYTLRFEEFSVRNGPDLYVYLSTSAEGYGDGSLELGTLKATDGAFNYELPPGTDVTRFESAVVWCKQFGVLFATAPFSPAT
jgi:hypothetical protein